MKKSKLDAQTAAKALHLVEQLLEIDDKVNFLNPTEFNALYEIIEDVKNHIK